MFIKFRLKNEGCISNLNLPDEKQAVIIIINPKSRSAGVLVVTAAKTSDIWWL